MQNSFTESCSKGAHRKFNVQYDLQHRATEIHKHGGLLVGLAINNLAYDDFSGECDSNSFSEHCSASSTKISFVLTMNTNYIHNHFSSLLSWNWSSWFGCFSFGFQKSSEIIQCIEVTTDLKIFLIFSNDQSDVVSAHLPVKSKVAKISRWPEEFCQSLFSEAVVPVRVEMPRRQPTKVALAQQEPEAQCYIRFPFLISYAESWSNVSMWTMAL